MRVFPEQPLLRRCLHRMTALLSGLLISTALLAQEIDEVVLIVDDIAVTAHEYSVLHYIKTQSDSFREFTPDLDDSGTQLIIEDLLLAAHAKRIAPVSVISDAQVDQALSGLASRNRLDPEQFLAQLEVQGVDTQIFLSALRQRLLVQEVIAQRMARGVAVTQSEIDEFINNRPELKSQAQKTYRVSHLVVVLEDDPSKDEVNTLRRQADAIRRQLQEGISFAEVAAQYENVNASGEQGDLGWKKQEELPELFVTALSGMRAGDVSEVLESNNGFHILALTDLKSAGSAPQEYRVRHILKSVPPGTDERQVAAELNNLKLQILAGLDFAAIAQAQSDDTASAVNGGDLGWIRLEQLDPGFVQGLLTLDIGQISNPVRSQFGLHLIQLMQLREAPGVASLEAQVQQRIFAEKLEEQMQDLLNELRQVALVEVVE